MMQGKSCSFLPPSKTPKIPFPQRGFPWTGSTPPPPPSPRRKNTGQQEGQVVVYDRPTACCAPSITIASRLADLRA